MMDLPVLQHDEVLQSFERRKQVVIDEDVDLPGESLDRMLVGDGRVGQPRLGKLLELLEHVRLAQVRGSQKVELFLEP